MKGKNMLEAGFVILNYNDYKTVYKLIDNIKNIVC